jgi:transposase-like protein
LYRRRQYDLKLPSETNIEKFTASEVKQLRKDLAEARLERDILKKATAYFARESLQGTRS